MTSDTFNKALEVDATAHAVVADHRNSPAVRLIGSLSEIGDQAQMRLLSGGVLLAGVVRGNPRLALAGMRMLLAHEVATALKNAVKRRVDRTRPRNLPKGEQDTPTPGGEHGKEESSFPSGHSAGAMAGACAFAAVYSQHRGPSLAGALAVGLAQIPRCAHYPTDVGAGIAIGAAADMLVGRAISMAARILR